MDENHNHIVQDTGEINNQAGKTGSSFRFLVFTLIIGLVLSFFLVLAVVRNLRSMQDFGVIFIPKAKDHFLTYEAGPDKLDAYMKKLEKDLIVLKKRSSGNIPKQFYLVVNTSDNDFRLYKGDELVREGICSTGSYTLLKTDGEKEWIFKTPRGQFRIQGKIQNPSWRKPDWAFVEEGLPVPPPNHPSRIEYGVLGDYAMSIGDGYLIHGTLYKRYLGMPVTHGCVRLGDDDLEAVFKSLQLGSKVYIY